MFWYFLPFALVIFWAVFVERFWFAIKSSELEILPKGSKDIVVLHISDIHMAPWQRYKQRWIARLAERTRPDLVIDTGDNLGHKLAIQPVLQSLRGFSGSPGVFVNGSNDLYAAAVRNPFSYLFHPSDRHREGDVEAKLDTDTLNSGFESLGWLNLNNRVDSLEINGTKLNFIGSDDPHELRDDLESAGKLLAKSNPNEVLIGVTHAPYLRVLEQFQTFETDMVFAGHTHGGQVCWPFIGRALVTNCDLPTKYARGLNQLNIKGKKLWLNVCAGLGNSIYAPVRLACRPEVRVVTLKAKN